MKSLSDLLQGFVQPFVAGGELRIVAPIDKQRVEDWTQEIDRHSEATGPIDDAREALHGALPADLSEKYVRQAPTTDPAELAAQLQAILGPL